MRGKEREKRRRRVRMRRKRTKVSGAKCSSRISKAADPCRMVGRRLSMRIVVPIRNVPTVATCDTYEVNYYLAQ